MHFAAVRVAYVAADYVVFDWSYQSAPGNAELSRVPTAMSESERPSRSLELSEWPVDIPAMANEVVIDGNSLTLEQVSAVARDRARVSLAPQARQRARRPARDRRSISGRTRAVAYGVTTGFGKLSEIAIPAGPARRAAGEPRAQPRGRRRATCSRSAKCAR